MPDVGTRPERLRKINGNLENGRRAGHDRCILLRFSPTPLPFSLRRHSLPPPLRKKNADFTLQDMSKKLGLLIALSILLTPSALATDFVTESNLTGFQLPKGALELTDDDFSEEMVEILDTTAAELNGKCKYHELLYWEGNPEAIAKALNAKIPKEFKYKNLDVGEMSDGGAYEQFVLTTPKMWVAGTWFQGEADVVLAWCTVVQK